MRDSTVALNRRARHEFTIDDTWQMIHGGAFVLGSGARPAMA